MNCGDFFHRKCYLHDDYIFHPQNDIYEIRDNDILYKKEEGILLILLILFLILFLFPFVVMFLNKLY